MAKQLVRLAQRQVDRVNRAFLLSCPPAETARRLADRSHQPQDLIRLHRPMVGAKRPLHRAGRLADQVNQQVGQTRRLQARDPPCQDVSEQWRHSPKNVGADQPRRYAPLETSATRRTSEVLFS